MHYDEGPLLRMSIDLTLNLTLLNLTLFLSITFRMVNSRNHWAAR